MPVRFQVAVDCADPARMTRFWSTALGYEVEPPPAGFPTWNEYWLSVGVPPEELSDTVDAADSLVDPDGQGPRIWFQPVPEAKSVKNRLHFDIKVGGGRGVPLPLRRERVDAEVERLVAAGASAVHVYAPAAMNHYSVLMNDPEGNEFCVA
jgi:catechol 2,3-dioxygenase-like lactoylglutathione lyase family enzyme